MLYDFVNGQTSVVIRAKLRNSSVTTGAGLAGLTNASSGLIVSTIADNEATATAYTVAAGNVETITTLGTYAAPTASKCRFKEVDATNHPGLYELQFADARFAVSGAKSITISLSGATNLAQCDIVIPLRAVNPYDAARMGMTALPSAVPGAAGGLVIAGSNAATTFATLAVSGAVTFGSTWTISGYTLFNSGVTMSAAGPNQPGLQLDGVGSGAGLQLTGGTTGAGIQVSGGVSASDAVYVAGDMTVTGTTTMTGVVTMTAGLTANITGNLSGSVGSVTAAVTADVTKWNGTSVATPNTAGVPKVDMVLILGSAPTLTSGALDANVTQWNGTNVATPDTAGHPKVTIKSGTGTGEISLSSGAVSNVTTTATATNLTNAPTNGDLTATMKTSVTTAATAATPIAASVAGNVGGSVASVTAGVTVSTNNDKTGYGLASDGLDSVAITEPSGVASDFREMVVAVWRSIFKKSTLTATQLKYLKDDGTTAAATQTVSDDGTTQTRGAAS